MLRRLNYKIGVFFILLSFLFSSCSENAGDQGARGPRGGAPDNSNPGSSLTFQALPGISIVVTMVSGGTGTNGNFRPGDYLSVTFTLKYFDGTDIPISEINGSYILLAGPSSNYQRVLPGGREEQYYLDLKSASIKNVDNSYTYTFPNPIPSVYGTPLYDTTKFSSSDEWAGQALVDGTYTIGIAAYKYYYIDGKFYTDVGNATRDILLGSSSILDSRELVKQENCNQCHVQLMKHDGIFRDVKLCLLCHTAGAEDKNSTNTSDATNASIEFKVMIHKIHSGKHLPSVVGISRDGAGDPVYNTTLFTSGGGTYLIGESDVSKAKDYSKVSFPVWPNKDYPVLHKTGWWTSRPQKAWFLDMPDTQEQMAEQVGKGITECGKCHGDPDGAGPITKPLKGDLIYQKPTTRVCGACHDDWDPSKPYKSNGLTMNPQANDSSCATSGCHEISGTNLSIQDAHKHPYFNSTINKGFNVNLQNISGGSGPGGNFQVGDKVQVSFTITDDQGTNIPFPVLPGSPNRFSHPNARLYGAIAGPTNNRQILLHTYIPHNAIAGGPTYTMNLPQRQEAELLGVVTDTSPADGQSDANVYTTSHTPIHTNGEFLKVYQATIGSGSTTIVSDASAQQNYIEVQNASPFSSGGSWPTISIDYGLPSEEYMMIQYAQTTSTPQRLWFFSSLKRKPPLCGDYADCHLPSGFDNEGVTGNSDRRDCKRCHEMIWGPGSGWFAGVDLGAYTAWPFFPEALRKPHFAGGVVRTMSMVAKTQGVDYTLNPATGTITLIPGRFTIGSRVVIFYSSDFKIPPVYPSALYASETTGESSGKWTGKSIVNGTYTVGLWSFQINQPLANGERNVYHIGTPPAIKYFLIGTGNTINTNAISSQEKCQACHSEIVYHGGTRRGYDTCLLCHGTAGFEDRPHYSQGWDWEGADWWQPLDPIKDTPNVLVDFRSLIHYLHKGKDLANASTLKTVTTSSWEFNSYSGLKYYKDFSFPAMGGKTRNCSVCHIGDSWKEPKDRSHPTEQIRGVTKWAMVCGACHDSAAAASHIKSLSGSTGEMCGLCHDATGVEKYHKQGYYEKK